MNEDKLTTEEERLLAELASAQYFGALEHLKNMLTGQGVSKLLTNTLPNDELRYWQGFVAGIATFKVVAVKALDHDSHEKEEMFPKGYKGNPNRL